MPPHPLVFLGAICLVGIVIVGVEVVKEAKKAVLVSAHREKNDDDDDYNHELPSRAASSAVDRFADDEEAPLLRGRRRGSFREKAKQSFPEEADELHVLFPAVDLEICRFIMDEHRGNLNAGIQYLTKIYNIEKPVNSAPEARSDDAKAPSVQSPSAETPKDDGVEELERSRRNREELLSELSYISALEQEVERKKATLLVEEAALQALDMRLNDLKISTESKSTISSAVDSGIVAANSEVSEAASSLVLPKIDSLPQSVDHDSITSPLDAPLIDELSRKSEADATAANDRALEDVESCESEASAASVELLLSKHDSDTASVSSDGSWTDVSSESPEKAGLSAALFSP